jgi:hypothetical protein
MKKNIILFLIILFILYTIVSFKLIIDLQQEYYNNYPDIPKNVFLTFITQGDFNMPPDMEQTLINNKNNNPEFNFYVYNNKTCREFINNHFGQNILNVYNGLKPGAYKSDLVRYCLLYIEGGVYMDVKLILHDKLSNLINKYGEIYVKDPDWFPTSCKRGCNNAFIITRKNNPIFLDCIKQIEINYNNNYYGNNFLYPTGPCLLGYIIRSKYNDIEYKLKISSDNKYSSFDIVDENENIIVSSYPSYRDELKLFPGTTHYTELWDNKDIYTNNENFSNYIMLSLDEFNNKFNTNIKKLPSHTVLIGIDNDIIYEHILEKKGNYHLIHLMISYFMENIHSKLHKRKYYYMLNYEDGYNETISSSDVNNNYILTFGKYYKNNSNTIPILDYQYLEYSGYSENINIINTNFINWNDKINKCVWRGGLVQGHDYNFFDIKQKNLHPRQYFVDLYNNNKFNNINYSNEFMTIKDQIKYKYILDIDGYASTWSATVWKLYSGSVLLKQKSVWSQGYYDELIEWVHYIPIANDFSDLNEKIQWCIDNDNKCQEITKNSRKFVIEKLEWNRVKNDMITIFNKII